MINRTIIGKEIAQVLGVPQHRGRQVADVLLGMIVEGLIRGENVALNGFGTFAVQHRSARAEGRNPFNGEKMAIPASVGVRFRPHKALKAALNPAPMRKVGGDRNSPMSPPGHPSQRKRA